MAKNALKQDTLTGGVSLIDGMFIAGYKVATEEVFARVPWVGNGNFRSGAIKAGTAIAVSMASRQKQVQYIATGMLIDGAEDLVVAFKRRFAPNNMGARNGIPQAI